MHMTNTSRNTVRFLDVPEGTVGCGEFYEITVEKDGKRYESEGNCLYAPMGAPRAVKLAPGQTYDRDIQPGACVRSEKHLVPPCEIIVTYRLTEKIKERWMAMADRVNLDLRFQTEKARIDASKKEVEATR